MTGLAKVWARARDAAEAAACEGWANPWACEISMHA
jgi:hypothetical protein